MTIVWELKMGVMSDTEIKENVKMILDNESNEP